MYSALEKFSLQQGRNWEASSSKFTLKQVVVNKSSKPYKWPYLSTWVSSAWQTASQKPNEQVSRKTTLWRVHDMQLHNHVNLSSAQNKSVVGFIIKHSNLKVGHFIILKVYWTVDEQLPVCEMLLLERSCPEQPCQAVWITYSIFTPSSDSVFLSADISLLNLTAMAQY